MGSWARRLVLPAMLATIIGTTSGCALMFPVTGSVTGPEIRGWTEAPTTPDPALLAEAVDACLLSMDMAPQLVDSLVIQDQRGPDAAAFLWVRGDESASCLVSRDTDGMFSAQGSSMALTFPAPSTLQVLGVDCGPPTMIQGTLTTRDPSVVIVTESGREVSASVADGRYLAWWPGRDAPVSVEETWGGGGHGIEPADPSETLGDC